MIRYLTAAAFVVTATVAVAAQDFTADHKTLAERYQAALNKRDFKTIAALYAPDAIRITTEGIFLSGRDEIARHYENTFVGPLQDTKVTLYPGTTRTLTPDVAVIEGTFEVTGQSGVKGRYVNTIVRQRGEWMLASVVTIPDPAAPPK